MAEARTVETSKFAAPPAGLTTAYTLWIAYVLGAGMVGVILAFNFIVFLVNVLSGFFDVDTLITGVEHGRWLSIAVVVAALTGMAHWLRMRSNAMERKVVIVPLPGEILARISTPDIKQGDILCRARVEIGVRGLDLETMLRNDVEKFTKILGVGLNAALNDPVVRFSKTKVEEALALSLRPHVNGRDLAGVSLAKLTQIRTHRKPPAATGDVDEDGFSQGLPAVPETQAR